MTNTSTINTSIPAANSLLASAPIRGNFTAAYNDINALWAAISMVSGSGQLITASPAALNPSILTNQINLTIPGSCAVSVNPATMIQWVPYTIKDAAGNAASHFITITPTSGTIDGGANYVISNNYDSVDFYTDGTNVFTK